MNCNAVCPLASNNFSGTSLASACGGGAFLLFMGILEQFIRKKCDLEDPCHRVPSRNIPNDRLENLFSLKKKKTTFFSSFSLLKIMLFTRIEF